MFPLSSRNPLELNSPALPQKPVLVAHTHYGLKTDEQQFGYYEQHMAGLDAAKILLSNDPDFRNSLTPDAYQLIDEAIQEDAKRLNVADERHRANHDKLTGLLNRQGLEREMSKIREGELLIFLFADATNFKLVNDRFDHTTGDGMLREIGAVLRSSLRVDDGDLLARIGGDEFVAILKTSSKGNKRRTGEESPQEQMNSVRERIATEMDDMLGLYPHIRDLGFQLAFSSVLMHGGQQLDELKDAAEASMRDHKTGQHEQLGKHR